MSAQGAATCGCVQCWGGFITMVPPLVRLRLADGAYVFLEYHDYLGPTFWADRKGTREVCPGLMDASPLLDRCLDALDWWIKRGKRG